MTLPEGEYRLRGGWFTNDKRLNRLPEKDPNSRNYPTRRMLGRKADDPPKSKMWPLNVWLDQGQEGACTGFSRAHNMAAGPVVIPGVTNELAHQIYERAKVLDDYPGEDYEGCSVLGAVKAACEEGYVKEYHWAFHLEDFLHAMTYGGPCTIGCNWYSGMRDPDAAGYIHKTGSLDGGHAIIIIGQELVSGGDGPYGIDMDRSYVVWHNSWGKNWGIQGRAKMIMREFEALRQEDTEVCFSTDVKK